VKLVGSHATLRVDIDANALFLSDSKGGEQQVEIPSVEQPGWRVEADFIDSIRDGAPVRLTNFTDGVRYMEFTDTVHRNLT
jgi:hypothetical protein